MSENVKTTKNKIVSKSNRDTNNTRNSKKNNKKDNIIIANIREFIIFYNSKLKKTHIITFAISVIIFFWLLATLFIDSAAITDFVSSMNLSNNGRIDTIFTEKLPLSFLIVFSGITPYAFIPVIGVIGFPYALALGLVGANTFTMIIGVISGILQLFFTSMLVAAGINYCVNSTKKFRYSQAITFGLSDVMIQIYEIRKNDKKVQELKDKKLKKDEKREALNVKIEYKKLILATIIPFIFIALITLITGV